ncbi:MAG: ribonuclease PH [Planctomycetota bacterium]
MRAVSFTRGFVDHPAGSCLVSFGATRVLCTVSVEASVPPWLRGKGQGWLTAEYAMLPGSTGGGRKRREFGKRDGRSVEIQRLIGRSLRAAVDLERLGERTLTVDCDVLQADGGTRTAAISGAWVALHDALGTLDPAVQPDAYLRGQLAAVSVGICDDAVVCDLDYALDSRAEVDMNVVGLDAQLVEVQGTGEQGTFDRRQLDALLDAAQAGIAEIQRVQREALGL